MRYLSSTESFEMDAPDPLDPSAWIRIRLTDLDLINLIGSDFQTRPDGIDDDSFRGAKLLWEGWFLSPRALTLAKRKAHLRRLGRTESAWLALRPRRRAPKRPRQPDPERIAYLKENRLAIEDSCARHGWIDEFLALMRDLEPGIRKADAMERWKEARARVGVAKARP